MNNKFDWSKLSDDLEALLHEEITEEEIMNKYEEACNMGDEVDAVLCNLDHFLCDKDIREKDQGCRRMQETEMEKLIAFIRQGNIQKATKIHFLGES